MTVEIRALRREDDRSQIRTGEPAIDLFFQRYAGQNQFRYHIGTTYVAMHGYRILAFATVSAASLDADDLPGDRKRPPYPLPVLRIARLGVDAGEQGRGLGKAMLRFCIELAERLRDEVGCVGVVVDAKPWAEEFYTRFGFEGVRVSEGDSVARPPPRLMFLPLGAMPKKQA